MSRGIFYSSAIELTEFRDGIFGLRNAVQLPNVKWSRIVFLGAVFYGSPT
jgi:hypothetical protein